MSTLMKKIEVYCSPEEKEDVSKYIEGYTSHYEEVLNSKNNKIYRITFYAPSPALPEILDGLKERLDLRRKENMIVVLDVESGIGFPYRYGRRKLLKKVGILNRPLESLIEEAEDKARISIVHIALAAIAGIVALVGLYLDNPYIVIGAMLVSPIIAPIYSAGLGIAVNRKELLSSSILSLLILLGSAYASSQTAAIIARILGYHSALDVPGLGWYTIIVPALLGIAVITSEVSNTLEALSGVAIAAALIPPIALMADQTLINPGNAVKVLGIVITNVIFLILMAGLTAWIMLHYRDR